VRGGGHGQRRQDLVAALPDSVGRKEEERVNRRGPHGRDRREKRCHNQIVQTQREGAFSVNTPRHFGLAKLTGGGGGLQGMWASSAKLGQIQGDDLSRVL
jgi:hypothetical protein